MASFCSSFCLAAASIWSTPSPSSPLSNTCTHLAVVQTCLLPCAASQLHAAWVWFAGKTTPGDRNAWRPHQLECTDLSSHLKWAYLKDCQVGFVQHVWRGSIGVSSSSSMHAPHILVDHQALVCHPIHDQALHSGIAHGLVHFCSHHPLSSSPTHPDMCICNV